MFILQHLSKSSVRLLRVFFLFGGGFALPTARIGERVDKMLKETNNWKAYLRSCDFYSLPTYLLQTEMKTVPHHTGELATGFIHFSLIHYLFVHYILMSTYYHCNNHNIAFKMLAVPNKFVFIWSAIFLYRFICARIFFLHVFWCHLPFLLPPTVLSAEISNYTVATIQWRQYSFAIYSSIRLVLV